MTTTAAATEVDLAAVDLADAAVWDDGPPYELFARMQRDDPVHYSPQRNVPGEGGFWSITRFDDVRAVSRDHRTFSSERRGIFNVDDIGVPLDIQRLQLISMDPPRHDRLKAFVIKAFTPERVAAHEAAIPTIINDVLDKVAASTSAWAPTWRGWNSSCGFRRPSAGSPISPWTATRRACGPCSSTSTTRSPSGGRDE